MILQTDGRGLWSNVATDVRITCVQLGYFYDVEDIGELRVYFDEKAFDVRKFGLIYTDKKFLRQLRKFLKERGFNSTDVFYSEQGMQGYDYVSLDVGKKFIKSLRAKTNDLEQWRLDFSV